MVIVSIEFKQVGIVFVAILINCIEVKTFIELMVDLVTFLPSFSINPLNNAKNTFELSLFQLLPF